MLQCLFLDSYTPKTNVIRPISNKMRQSKLSIPSRNRQRFMMTLAILKILLVSICEPIMPSTWWTKNDTCGNCTTCVAHHTKGFLISISCTYNYCKTCNSFFNVDMIASLKKTIYPKRQSSYSNVVGSIFAFIRFKCK
jgi:hypothetical protein